MSERYSSLFRLQPRLYAEGSPVVISAGTLLKDNENGKVLAQLKFCNILQKKIKAIKVRIHCFDTTQNRLGKPVEFQYLDLAVKPGQEFGSKTPIYLDDNTTRAYEVEIVEVIFEDLDSICLEGVCWEPLPEQVLIEDAYELSYGEQYELLKQYRLTYGKDSKFQPMQTKDLWLCTCGTANRSGTDCSHCGQNLAALESVDWEQLKADKAVRLVEEEKLLKKRVLIGAIVAAVAILFIWLIVAGVKQEDFLESGVYDTFEDNWNISDYGFDREAKYGYFGKKITVTEDWSEPDFDPKAEDADALIISKYLAKCKAEEETAKDILEHFDDSYKYCPMVNKVVYTAYLNEIKIFECYSGDKEPYYLWNVDEMGKNAKSTALKEMKALLETAKDYDGVIEYVEDLEGDFFGLDQDPDILRLVVKAANAEMKAMLEAKNYEGVRNYTLDEDYRPSTLEETKTYDQYKNYAKGMSGFYKGSYSLKDVVDSLEKAPAGFMERDTVLAQAKAELAPFLGKSFTKTDGEESYALIIDETGEGRIKVKESSYYYSKFELCRAIATDSTVQIYGKDDSEYWFFTTDGTNVFVTSNRRYTFQEKCEGSYTLDQ